MSWLFVPIGYAYSRSRDIKTGGSSVHAQGAYQLQHSGYQLGAECTNSWEMGILRTFLAVLHTQSSTKSTRKKTPNNTRYVRSPLPWLSNNSTWSGRRAAGHATTPGAGHRQRQLGRGSVSVLPLTSLRDPCSVYAKPAAKQNKRRQRRHADSAYR